MIPRFTLNVRASHFRNAHIHYVYNLIQRYRPVVFLTEDAKHFVGDLAFVDNRPAIYALI